ncbi:MAG: pyridoxamine 5'-phosphate oxidase family protein, partial [Clostridiales bacterium]
NEKVKGENMGNIIDMLNQSTESPAKQQLDKILEQSIYLQIAAIYQNKPYLIAMNYAYHQGKIYLHGANKNSKKAVFLANTPIAFQIIEIPQIITGEYPCQATCNYQSLLGEGILRPLAEAEKISALDLISRKYSPQSPLQYKEAALEKTAVWLIEIQKLTGKINNY